MAYEYKLGGYDIALGRKQRVRREFSIMMRPIKGTSSSSFDPEPAPAAPPKKRKWSKFLRKIFQPRGEKPDSLMDAMVEFTKRKSKHWALVIHENGATPGGKQFSRRLFEICGQPPPGSIPEGDTSYSSEPWSDMPDSISEDELDDLYDADDQYPEPSTLGSTMQMHVSGTIAAGFKEPHYSQGGVFWDLLDRLRAETKFTNAEIQNEAKRIWSRQQNYRMFNNNCHRFCILLAIDLRAKQESTLRILTGDILKAQTTEGQFSAPVENPLPKRK